MTPEEKVIRGIESLLIRLKAINDRLSKTFPRGDLRPATIGLMGNVLHSYLLHFAMAAYTITHKSWWKEAYRRDDPLPSDIEALSNLESMTKHATFVFFLSRIEWSFRKLTTFLYPGACSHGSAAFKTIYDYLLSHLGLDRFIPLYDVCRHLRNSIHSNGVFVSRNGTDETVSWKGVDYEFRHMNPIDSVEEILGATSVSGAALIEDKIH